jgi:hypothetical protein
MAGVRVKVPRPSMLRMDCVVSDLPTWNFMTTQRSSQSTIQDSSLATSSPRNGITKAQQELLNFICAVDAVEIAKAIEETVDTAFYSDMDIKPDLRVDMMTLKAIAKVIKKIGKEEGHEG